MFLCFCFLYDNVLFLSPKLALKLLAFILYQFFKIPVVSYAEDGSFPGLYCSSILSDPWLSDGCTLVLPSVWHSSQVLLSVNVLR